MKGKNFIIQGFLLFTFVILSPFVFAEEDVYIEPEVLNIDQK